MTSAPNPAAGPGVPRAPESYTRPDDRTFRWVFTDLEPLAPTDHGLSPSDIVLAFSQPLLHQAQPGTVLPDIGPRIEGVSSSDEIATPDNELAGSQAADGVPNTAWAIRGPGTGAWIKLRLGPTREPIREVRILIGNNRQVGGLRQVQPAQDGAPELCRWKLEPPSPG